VLGLAEFWASPAAVVVLLQTLCAPHLALAYCSPLKQAELQHQLEVRGLDKDGNKEELASRLLDNLIAQVGRSFWSSTHKTAAFCTQAFRQQRQPANSWLHP
jgi:hypothetical protein